VGTREGRWGGGMRERRGGKVGEVGKTVSGEEGSEWQDDKAERERSKRKKRKVQGGREEAVGRTLLGTREKERAVGEGAGKGGDTRRGEVRGWRNVWQVNVQVRRSTAIRKQPNRTKIGKPRRSQSAQGVGDQYHDSEDMKKSFQ